MRSADAVRSQDHHLCRLEPLHTFWVIVDDAGHHAVLIGSNLPYPAARAQFDAGAKRLWPIGDIYARLGAAWCAMTEIDAPGTAFPSRSSPPR
jgi:hypothetical protein